MCLSGKTSVISSPTPEWIAYALERAHGGHWLPRNFKPAQKRYGRARSLAHQLERLTEAYLQSVIPLS